MLKEHFDLYLNPTSRYSLLFKLITVISFYDGEIYLRLEQEVSFIDKNTLLTKLD